MQVFIADRNKKIGEIEQIRVVFNSPVEEMILAFVGHSDSYVEQKGCHIVIFDPQIEAAAEQVGAFVFRPRFKRPVAPLLFLNIGQHFDQCGIANIER